MKTSVIRWTMALFLGGIAPAQAFFDYEDRPNPDALLAKCHDKGQVAEIGSGYAHPVDTFGVDVPFREAVGLLLPKRWHVQVIDVPGSLAMTWEGERPWVDILHTLAGKYGLCIVVDWDNHGVWIRGGEHTRKITAERSRSGADVARVDVKSDKGDRMGAVSAKTKSWRLKGGRMLDEVLSEWADRAGWQLAWNLDVRYRVPYDTAVNGDFIDAVRKVLASYRNAQIPLGAVVHRGGIGKPVLEIVPYIPFQNRVIESGENP